MGVLSVGGWLFAKIRSCLKARELQRVSRSFYGDIKESLNATKGTAFGGGLSQADILRKYMALPNMKDGLKRDEKTFN